MMEVVEDEVRWMGLNAKEGHKIFELLADASMFLKEELEDGLGVHYVGNLINL